ncbi:hypothetical protein [Legionella bononiensis]|uniref:Ankyrin repeat protein n=1 Tax=Legionella bononiensis TaxID=2793102 RepID=A0ABS1W824_9GAMM|nr:hypothetical protein [Legionella bononiensis]MBL7479973.1 hypothetical protein [Legionella bononiensis]MBL7525513.1 hypothetical protein [Legionella bononiensis]MBL7561696.1 hypothetical protein [Legionella bononiensis]
MILYESISKQFSEFNLEIDFKTTAILQYMVLEKAGCLNSLKGMPLITDFLFSAMNNNRLDDNCRSHIYLGFDGKENDLSKSLLEEIFGKVLGHFNSFVLEPIGKEYDMGYSQGHLVLLDREILDAIKSSSLYIAAGDISKLDLDALLELTVNISLYKTNDEKINGLVDKLTIKIAQHIGRTFDKTKIDEAIENVKVCLFNQKQQFNELVVQFNDQIAYLKNKGTPFLAEVKGIAREEDTNTPNPDFVPEYKKLAIAANKLKTTLENARDNFFDNAPTETSLKLFQETCSQAIKEARIEFSKHQGLWDQLHPILKGILGVIALITIIPAAIVQLQSPRGFVGTFFKTPKPDSLAKLESFEKDLSGMHNIFDDMAKPTQILNMLS